MSLSTFLENVCQSELCGRFQCDHIWDDGGRSGQKRKWIEFLGKGSLCGPCTIFWQAEGEGKSWHPWRVLTAFFISNRRGRSRGAWDGEAVIGPQLPDDRGEEKGDFQNPVMLDILTEESNVTEGKKKRRFLPPRAKRLVATSLNWALQKVCTQREFNTAPLRKQISPCGARARSAWDVPSPWPLTRTPLTGPPQPRSTVPLGRGQGWGNKRSHAWEA